MWKNWENHNIWWHICWVSKTLSLKNWENHSFWFFLSWDSTRLCVKNWENYTILLSYFVQRLAWKNWENQNICYLICWAKHSAWITIIKELKWLRKRHNWPCKQRPFAEMFYTCKCLLLWLVTTMQISSFWLNFLIQVCWKKKQEPLSATCARKAVVSLCKLSV